MKRFQHLAAVVLSAAFAAWLAGCRSPAPSPPAQQRFEFSRPEMATMFTITLYAPDFASASNAAYAAFNRVAALNLVMSDYDPESELTMFCKRPVGTAVKLSSDLYRALDRALETAGETEGAFDPTVGPMVQLWRRARRQRELPAADKIAEAQQAVGWRYLRLDAQAQTGTLLLPNMRLDLGGIGKGIAADAALAVLRQHGFSRAMVAASGDLAIGDAPPGKTGWWIGIGSIDAKGDALTRLVLLANAGVSTSGDTEQYVELGGKRYSHIVDPRTGIGLTARLGGTIVARDATTSDALATAVSVMGVERGLRFIERRRDLAALIVHLEDNGRKQMTESSRFKRLRLAPLPLLKE